MNLEEKFKELRKKEEGALIGFITAGDPTIEDTGRLVKVMADGGIDMLELGLPFSDPIADGVTIQKASERSLNGGITPDIYFESVAGIKEVEKICLTYYNLVFQRGLEEFVHDCNLAGVAGLIVPDLPVEESKPLLKFCDLYDLNLIFLVAPTTTEKRILKILDVATGFIYIVSLLGVTGVRETFSGKVSEVIKKIRKFDEDIPLAVGFGISKPEHVRQVCEIADGAIVGSAFIRIVERNLEEKEVMLKELEDYSRKLKRETKHKPLL